MTPPPPPPPRAPEAGRFAPRTLFAFLFCLTCVWGAPGSGEAQGNTEADCGTRDEAATRTVTCETAQSPYERVHIDARSAGAGIGTVKLVVGANARVEATAPSDAVGVLALERDIEIEIGTGARILSRVPPGGTPGSYFGGGTGVARWSGEFGVRPTGRTAVTVRESASVYGALNGISVYGDGSVTAMGTVESGFELGYRPDRRWRGDCRRWRFGVVGRRRHRTPRQWRGFGFRHGDRRLPGRLSTR